MLLASKNLKHRNLHLANLFFQKKGWHFLTSEMYRKDFLPMAMRAHHFKSPVCWKQNLIKTAREIHDACMGEIERRIFGENVDKWNKMKLNDINSWR